MWHIQLGLLLVGTAALIAWSTFSNCSWSLRLLASIFGYVSAMLNVVRLVPQIRTSCLHRGSGSISYRMYTLMSVGGLLNVYFQVFSSHERLSTVVSTMVGNMMFFIVLFVCLYFDCCARRRAGAKDRIYSGTPAPKPGLCQRMCRCLPFSSKSGQNKAVSQAPPASRTEPPKPATGSGMSGQVVEQPIAGDARPSEPAIQQPGMPVEPAQPASEPPALEELEDGRDGGRGNQAPTSHPVVGQPGARAQPSELPAGDFIPQEPRENEGAEERKLQALRRFEDDGRAIAAPVGEN
eukprot:symbB.v1.2.008496.t1/scaffold535.1/size190655/16